MGNGVIGPKVAVGLGHLGGGARQIPFRGRGEQAQGHGVSFNPGDVVQGAEGAILIAADGTQLHHVHHGVVIPIPGFDVGEGGRRRSGGKQPGCENQGAERRSGAGQKVAVFFHCKTSFL